MAYKQKVHRTSSAYRPTTGLGLAALLSLGLLLISFARLIGDTRSAAFNMSLVENALDNPIWHTRLGLNIVLFVLAMLALHLTFGFLCWLMAVLSDRAFPAARCPLWQWILLWFLSGAIWLLIDNAAHFPNSSLGEPYHALATARLFGITPYVLTTALVLAGITAALIMFLYRHDFWRRKSWLLAGAIPLALAVAGFSWKENPRHAGAESGPPNVIFLGIDSMRPDFVNANTAPHVSAFMDGAVRFTDAVTPLARTFPAWISILTGRHPHTTGAYVNLIPRHLIHTGVTLPQALHEHGYRTYYAMDETRFANIDASYGFDRTLTSTIGGSDFVLSWFADTPLSNVVMNTWLGALLFPHVYANRSAHVTYEPDTFVRRVIGGLDPEQPVFLASHLTLPHWPYTWASSAPIEPVEANYRELYGRAVHRADQQFGDILAGLAHLGILDNAIVVALSDHGEALGRPEDFMLDAFPDNATGAPSSQDWGHGTSVFSPTQYHVVLGIRAYGAARTLLHQPANENVPVSLIDLAPTIMDLLKIEPEGTIDGISLASLLRTGSGATTEFENRIRFTETEYNPKGFLPTNLTASALSEAAKLYHLDSATDRIVVRESALQPILVARQYAALLGEHAMAIALPDEQEDGKDRFIFIPDSSASHVNTNAEILRLRESLQQRFGIRFADPEQSGPAS
jgi:arylsulfatase A-like enzyme